MRIKSYFAESVEEAMDRARTELGSEAMLMNTKDTEAEFRHLGRYEVVFGLAFSDAGPAVPQTAPALPAANGKPGYSVAGDRRPAPPDRNRQAFHVAADFPNALDRSGRRA